MTSALTPRDRGIIDATAFALLSAEGKRRVRARFLGALAASKFYARKNWPLVVVCCTPDMPERVVLRAELAEEFRSNGDEASAHECMIRGVGPGCVLVWIVVDSAVDGAGAGFVVVSLVGGRR
jgi:hypothetical protein